MESLSKNSSDAPTRLYGDDEMLMLSGIQHYRFCPRQWALIHVEQQWQNNHLTLQGDALHKNVDRSHITGSRNGGIAITSMAIASHTLGLSGIADMLELTPANDTNNAVVVPSIPGNWHITPIEYKHGRSKQDSSDDVQLCAQAICLEEMYGINLQEGEIFYHTTRRRKSVPFTRELRCLVKQLADEMHHLFENGTTPLAVWSAKCNSCSLNDICMVGDYRKSPTVEHYLKQLTDDEETA